MYFFVMSCTIGCPQQKGNQEFHRETPRRFSLSQKHIGKMFVIKMFCREENINPGHRAFLL